MVRYLQTVKQPLEEMEKMTRWKKVLCSVTDRLIIDRITPDDKLE